MFYDSILFLYFDSNSNLLNQNINIGEDMLLLPLLSFETTMLFVRENIFIYFVAHFTLQIRARSMLADHMLFEVLFPWRRIFTYFTGMHG